jgi:hypothetical protein
MIYGSPYCSLPVNEEIKLRRKLQYIKHPEIYEIEELNENISSLIDDNIEDISNKRKFSENAQYIFFAMIKNALIDVKKTYIIDGVFDSQKFLENISNEELRDFWEKLINTVSFEFFILSYQYLDDSNTKIFKNICSNENDEDKILNKQGLFEYNMNFPNFMNLFSDLEYKANVLSNVKHKNMSSYIEKLKNFNQNYNQILGEQKVSIHTQSNSLKRFPKTQKKEESAKRDNFSYDFSNKRFLDNSIENVNINTSKISTNHQHLKNSSSSHFDSINEKKRVFFRIYGKGGFLYFFQEIFAILSKKEISQLGYHQEILLEINYINILRINKNIENSKILEMGSENSLNSSFDNNSYNKIGFEKPNMCILDIPKNECFQYYLLLAFYLGEYADNKDDIFNLYNKAGELDKRSFPCIRFFQYLDEFNDLQKIRSFLSSSSNKLIAKIISYKIKLKQKFRTMNYNDLKSKPCIFEDCEKEEEEKKYLMRQSSKKLTLRDEDNTYRFPSFKVDRKSMIDGIDNIVYTYNIDRCREISRKYEDE